MIVAAKVIGTLTCTVVAVRWIARIPALAWTIGMGPLPSVRTRQAQEQTG